MFLIKLYKKMYAPLYMAVLIYACYLLRLEQTTGTGHLALSLKDAHMLSDNLAAAIMTIGYGTYATFVDGIVNGAPWYQHFVFLTFIVGPTICWIFWKDFGQYKAVEYMIGIAMCGSFFFTGKPYNLLAMLLTLSTGFIGLFVICGFIMLGIWTFIVRLLGSRK